MYGMHSKREHITYSTSVDDARHETESAALAAAQASTRTNERVYMHDDAPNAHTGFCVCGYVDLFGRYCTEFLHLPAIEE